jgi:hypothetical protein
VILKSRVHNCGDAPLTLVNVMDKADEFRLGNSPLAPKEPSAAKSEAEAA